MALGITRASIVSAIANDTGDDSSDALTKIRRLLNRKGREFCNITNFPFLNSLTSFSITTANYRYSGASYLPTTFKKATAAWLIDGNDKHPLEEISLLELRTNWHPENSNWTGRPQYFAIEEIASGYWRIAFNVTPDKSYDAWFNMELQWTDLTASTSETVITKPFFSYFVHFCNIARFRQQGDTENWQAARDEWFSPATPNSSLLTQLLSSLGTPIRYKRVVPDMSKIAPHRVKIEGDYQDKAGENNDW